MMKTANVLTVQETMDMEAQVIVLILVQILIMNAILILIYM